MSETKSLWSICADADLKKHFAMSLWTPALSGHPSCTNPAMTMSDTAAVTLGSQDPTAISVDMSRLPEGQRGRCIWYQMKDSQGLCEVDMDKIQEVYFDVSASNCGREWICPLWTTPRDWGSVQDKSGEIDFMENCNGSLNISFGQNPGEFRQWGLDAGTGFNGHVNLLFDQNADVVSGTFCPYGPGGCKEFSYKGYFAATAANRHRQVGGGPNLNHFISDIWNGTAGSALDYCGQGRDFNTTCKYSVSNIKIKNNDGPAFPAGRGCSALNA